MSVSKKIHTLLTAHLNRGIKMLQFLSLKNIAIATGLFDLGERMYKTYFSSEDPVTKQTSSRKKRDSTRFTQAHYDVIVSEHSDYLLAKAAGISGTTKDLTNLLNTKLGLSKCRSAYGRIWNGKINRDDLAEK